MNVIMLNKEIIENVKNKMKMRVIYVRATQRQFTQFSHIF